MAGTIDTGQGGFDIDGQAYLYDVGLSEEDGGSQGPHKKTIDVSPAYQDAGGLPKDLTKKTKITLARYLSDQTIGKGESTQVPNRYPVDPGYATLANTTKSGNPALQTPGAGQTTNSKAFAPAGVPTSLGVTYSSLVGLKKGKSDQPGTDGNDLLPGLPGNATYTAAEGTLQGTGPASPPVPMQGHPDTTGIVGPFVSAVLTNNRFTGATAPFAGKGDDQQGTTGFNPSLVLQSVLGAYDPRATSWSFDRLANVGPLLTMRAGKELLASVPGTVPTSIKAQEAAMLPGITQLGIAQVETVLLEASDVLAGLSDEPLDSAHVTGFGDMSWGALNNTEDPFSGMDAVGMVALSLALVAGLELLVEGLSSLLGLITSQARRPSHDVQGRYALGEYYAGAKQARRDSSGGVVRTIAAASSLDFGAMLGIQPTNFPFSQALSAGMNAFFGLPTEQGAGARLAGAFVSSVDSPGFNVVVARTIVRSGASIVSQARNVGGHPIGAASQVLALVDAIRGSKLISACNVFAGLGDAVLSLPPEWVDRDALGGVKVSRADHFDNSLSNGVNKNRLKGVLKMAWASNRAPANILLPSSLLSHAVHASGFGQHDPMLGVRSDALSRVDSVVITDTNVSRIDPATAAAFETTLDAEYVPFYFHDVRTNEMVSFHAFLASLTDDYTAAYERTEGHGRVEPVKTYRGTERRIGMSFYVAATSPQDFDEMWLKINKLVTLVYPQFTKGLSLSSGDGTSYKFTQPFSQLIGASPLVRLRLGDLLKSNYSRFGLARLFGLGNPDLTLNSQKADRPNVDAGALEKYAGALRAVQGNPQGETYHVAPGSYPYIDPSTLGIKLPAPSPRVLGNVSGPKFAPVFSPGGAPPGMLLVKARAVDPASSGDAGSLAAGATQLVCEVALNDDPGFQATYSRAMAAVIDEHGNPQRPLQNVVGGTYSIPIAALTATKKTKQHVLQKAVPAPGGSFATELGAFLSPGGQSPNAIAKSFNDTGGKGLAGFIETLNFDWYDKAMWETTPDRTAPMFCKVTLAFSPIHDITPGLDHMGFNRAPLYPVGVLAQQFDPTRGGKA